MISGERAYCHGPWREACQSGRSASWSHYKTFNKLLRRKDSGWPLSWWGSFLKFRWVFRVRFYFPGRNTAPCSSILIPHPKTRKGWKVCSKSLFCTFARIFTRVHTVFMFLPQNKTVVRSWLSGPSKNQPWRNNEIAGEIMSQRMESSDSK